MDARICRRPAHLRFSAHTDRTGVVPFAQAEVTAPNNSSRPHRRADQLSRTTGALSITPSPISRAQSLSRISSHPLFGSLFAMPVPTWQSRPPAPSLPATDSPRRLILSSRTTPRLVYRTPAQRIRGLLLPSEVGLCSDPQRSRDLPHGSFQSCGCAPLSSRDVIDEQTPLPAHWTRAQHTSRLPPLGLCAPRSDVLVLDGSSNSEISCLGLGHNRRPRAAHVNRLELDGTRHISRPLAIPLGVSTSIPSRPARFLLCDSQTRPVCAPQRTLLRIHALNPAYNHPHMTHPHVSRPRTNPRITQPKPTNRRPPASPASATLHQFGVHPRLSPRPSS